MLATLKLRFSTKDSTKQNLRDSTGQGAPPDPKTETFPADPTALTETPRGICKEARRGPQQSFRAN